MVRIEILNLALVPTHWHSWESSVVRVNVTLGKCRALQQVGDGTNCMAVLLVPWCSVCDHSFTRAHLSRVSFPGQPGRCRASTKVSRAMCSGAGGSIQMKVMFPRAGYAREDGEWSLRAGDVVVMLRVCVLSDNSPAAADSALAQPALFR